MNASAAAARPTRHPEVAAELVGDEVLLYHPARTEALYLNATSALIWSLCDGQRDIGAIVDVLAGAYPDTSPGLLSDVEGTIAHLVSHGVVTLG